MSATFWPPDALADHTFTDPPYLVHPFLPLGGLGILHGPPGVGKSQLALTMAAAAAAGTPFLTPEYPTSQGKTLYVQMDVIAKTQQERLRAAASYLKGLPIAFLTALGGEGANAFEPAARQPALLDAMKWEPRLVVVDTLRDAHLLDENDSKTPSLVFGGWRKLFPGATLLFLHHDRKLQLANGGGVPDRFKRETASGTRAWLAKADVGMHLHDWKRSLTLAFSKVRTCAPQLPLPVKLREPDLLVELAEPTARHKAMTWLATQPPAARTKSAVAGWLQEQKLCSKATAYRVADEVIPEPVSRVSNA